MNDRRNTGPRPAPAARGDDAAAIELLRGSDPRQPVPPEVLERSWQVAHRAWRQNVGRRRRRRASWMALGAAAAVALVAGTGLLPSWAKRLAGGELYGSSDPVAVLEAVAGTATATGADGESGLDLGDRLAAGAVVTTGVDARAAFRLAGGQSLRLGAGSRLRWLSDGVVFLEHGALYFDSQPYFDSRPHFDSGPHLDSGPDTGDGAMPPAEPIEVRTEYGSATDVGTQFEIRVTGGALRVRVREGRVRIDQGSRSVEAGAGSEWTLHDGGRVSRQSVPAHGAPWRSYLEVAPPFELEGSSLRAFLRWVARETGWHLVFADPAIQLSASGITLHGSLAGVPADRAHEMVLETCGLKARLEDGNLFIDYRPTR